MSYRRILIPRNISEHIRKIKDFSYKKVSGMMDFPTPKHDRINVTIKHVIMKAGRN